MSKQGVSRRNLLRTGAGVGLAALVLGGGGFALHSCTREGGLDFGENGLDDPYDIWRQVQAALRTSPDHAAARARALVAAGDVGAIHRFVRDEIRLVSGEAKRLRLGAYVKWGPRAALRAGAGTAREKAEILAALIRDTGRDASVVEMGELRREAEDGVFYRDFFAPFAPQVDKSQVERWSRALGQPTLDVDAAASERETLQRARELRAQIPAEDQQRIARLSYDDRIVGNVPVVRFTEAGQGDFIADPIRPDAVVTPVGTTRLRDAPAMSGVLPVSISLTATVLDETVAPYEIARAEWTAEELAGRQVRVGFKPFGDTREILASRISDVRAFTPCLSIQALDGEALDSARAVVMGESFTLEGDRISQSATGEVRINDIPLDASPPSGRAGEVATIEVEASAARFPDMRLLVRPRGGDGAIIDGLTARDFALTDEGEAVGHLLHERERAPHILFLADASGSMPKAFIGAGAWRQGDAMTELIATVEAMAKAIHPHSMVTVESTDSNMWRHLLRNVGSPANLIIYATDGDLDGAQPTPEQIVALGTGPKAIVMDVHGRLDSRRERNGDNNIFDAMAKATNGLAVNVTAEDTAQVQGAIQSFLEEETRDLPYVLSYRAPSVATGVRKAGVAIDKAKAEAAYEVGATSADARKVCALDLTIRIGTREIKRRLCGQDGRGVMAKEQQDAFHGALLGEHLIALEGPAPSRSTILDDIITARLSVEAMDKAARDKSQSFDDMVAVLDKGMFSLPKAQAALLMRPGALSGDNFSFAEQGMRVVLHSQHPILNTDQLVSRVDILPFNHAYVISPDQAVVLEKAFDSSMMLAAGEQVFFPVNTATALQGKPLAPLSRAIYENSTLLPHAEDRHAWIRFVRQMGAMFPSGYVALTAADGSTHANWAVSHATGEVFAILPDGSGGGHLTDGMVRQLQEIDKVISMLNLLVTAAAASGAVNALGGVSLALVAAYGQTLARLYAAASMSVLMMDPGGMDPIMRQAFAGLACNVAKTFFLSVISAGGGIALNAVNIFAAGEGAWGAVGGSSPTFCTV